MLESASAWLVRSVASIREDRAFFGSRLMRANRSGLLVADCSNFGQVFQFALFFAVFARDGLLRCQSREQVMRLDFLALGKQPRIRTKHFDERVNLRFRRLSELNEIVALFGGKEVVRVDRVEFRVHTIDAANPLNEPSRVPRNVIIDDDIRAVQVHAFRKHFRANQNPVVIAGMERVRVEVCDHVLVRCFVRLARE